MAAVTVSTPSATTTAPIRVPAAAWLAVAVGLALVYFMLQENGALLDTSWKTAHELFHNGRHASGVPCH